MRKALAVAIALAGHAHAQSSIRSDDFNTQSLRGFWELVDPVGDVEFGLQGWQTEDAQLVIDVPGGTSHDLWSTGNLAPRVLQSAPDADLGVEAKFDSIVQERFQLQGILVEEDFGRFLRFEVHHDGQDAHIYVASVTGTNADVKHDALVPDAPGILRVLREGDLWTLLVSYDGGLSFITETTFVEEIIVTKIGVHAGNHQIPDPSLSPPFRGLVDYFFSLSSVPGTEDGPSAGRTRSQSPGGGGPGISAGGDRATPWSPPGVGTRHERLKRAMRLTLEAPSTSFARPAHQLRLVEWLSDLEQGISGTWSSWQRLRLELGIRRLDGFHHRGQADSWLGAYLGDLVTERRLQLRLHSILRGLTASGS